MGLRILIVEDEISLAITLSQTFKHNGFYCVLAESAEKARAILANDLNYDLIILDWKLPGISGKRFLNEIRTNSAAKFAPELKKIPVIMLTALDGLENKVDALSAGADDYISKPFANEELIARVRAVVRRTTIDNKQDTFYLAFPQGKLMLNNQNRQASFEINLKESTSKKIKVIPINLSTLEFNLFYFLTKNKNRAFSREQLLDHLWQDTPVGNRTVDVTIKRIRSVIKYEMKKIINKDFNFEVITTVRGVGYGIFI